MQEDQLHFQNNHETVAIFQQTRPGNRLKIQILMLLQTLGSCYMR